MIQLSDEQLNQLGKEALVVIVSSLQDQLLALQSQLDHANAQLSDNNRQIELLTKDPEVGEVYEGTVTRIMSFGAFIEILPGKEGLLHISKMAKGRVEKVEDVMNIGDKVEVKIYEIDNQNRINLMRTKLPDLKN